MSAGGSIGTSIPSLGGKTLIVGNRVGGSNNTVAKFLNTSTETKTINLNPDVAHALSLDIAGYTDVKLQMTRANPERVAALQASFSTGTVVGVTADSTFLGVIEAGHTAVKVTCVKTASSPTDDAVKQAALGGARASLSILEMNRPVDANGNPIAAPYNGPVITSDEETPAFTSA